MDQAKWENLTYNSPLPGSMYVRHWKTPSFLGVFHQLRLPDFTQF